MNSLYIFVDSERPDQYLNSLVYCSLRKNVRRVVFVHIRGFGDAANAPNYTDGLSGRVMGAVQAQLEGLAERGEYLFKSGPRLGERVLLKSEYTDQRVAEIQLFYKACRDLPILYSNDELDYENLRKRLRAIAKEGHTAYVDVTAVKKRYLGDVVSAGLVEGLGGLHTFDLVGAKPDFERPWLTLVHQLEQSSGRAFEYIDLLNTPVYRKCARLILVRAPRLEVSLGVTAFFLAVVALGYWRLGSQSPWTQTMFAVSGASSILSLVLVFLMPRGR